MKQSRRSRVTTVPFQSAGIYQTITTGGGTTAGAIDLSPSTLSTRLAVLATVFKKWRFKRALRARMWSEYENVLTNNAGTFANGGTSAGIGFYGASSFQVTTPFNSVSDVAELVQSRVGPMGPDKPLELVIPVSQLRIAAVAGNDGWCFTNNTGVGAYDLICGSIQYAINQQATTTNGSRYWIELSGAVEFCEPTDPTVQSVSDVVSERVVITPNDLEKDDVKSGGAERRVTLERETNLSATPSPIQGSRLDKSAASDGYRTKDGTYVLVRQIQ